VLFWHTDKLLWKNSRLHEEHGVIINEWSKEVMNAMNEAKEKLSQHLKTSGV